MNSFTSIFQWYFRLLKRVCYLPFVIFFVFPTLPATAQNRFSRSIKEGASNGLTLSVRPAITPAKQEEQTPEKTSEEVPDLDRRGKQINTFLEDSSLNALLVQEQHRLHNLFKCASEEAFFIQLQRIPHTSVCWRLLPFQNPIDPTHSLRLTSPFGYRRHPLTKKWTLHKGIDIAAAAGTWVYAAGAGFVTAAGYDPLLGNFVRINHGFGWSSIYGHLSAISVQKGSKLLSNELIGLSGSSGRVTGPHLHFGVYYNKKPVDGSRFLNLLKKLTN